MSDNGNMDADLYAILNVSANAPANVIRAAANAMSREWHPDRNSGSEATQRMQDINLATAILLDAEKRATYDERQQALGNRSQLRPRGDTPYHFPSETSSMFLLPGGTFSDPENYSDVDFIVSREKVVHLGPLLLQLDRSIKFSRSVIFIAPDVDDEIVATFRINNFRGVLRCAVLLAPGFGRHKSGLIEDMIAIAAAGARDISPDYVAPDRFMPADGQSPSLLVGHAERATLTASGVNLFRGAGDGDLVRRHLHSLIDMRSTNDDGADSLSRDPAGIADRIDRLALYLGEEA